MTAKEKAEKIFTNYLSIVTETDGTYNLERNARLCALEHVQYVIDTLEELHNYSDDEFNSHTYERINYYIKVYKQIELL